MLRRILLTIGALFYLSQGWAQAYPDKPVRIVVPYPVGGPVDAIGRKLAASLQAKTAQPFLVENRGGAGGSIGADVVAKAAPDGYTLLLTIPDALINVVATVAKLPYDAKTDFAFITQVASSGVALMANPGLEAASLAELEAAAKASSGLAFGSWGPGSFPHVLGQAMVQSTGADLVHVPYRGVAPAIQDVLSRQIAFTFGPSNLARQYAESGQVAVLAVSGEERSPLLPDVPTFSEQGYDAPVFRFTVWVGLLAPAKTPGPVIDFLHRQVDAILQEADFRDFLASLDFKPAGSTPEAFRQGFDEEFPVIIDLIRSTGLSPQ